MGAVRAAGPVVLGGVLLSGAIVFVSELWFIRAEDLAGTDRDWAGVGGVIAMAFFAFMVGALSTVAAAVLARWFPIGLVVFTAVAIGLGVYVTSAALDQKPVLAPMFIVLHAVFVSAFGMLLPYRLYVHRGSQPATSRFGRS
jgi:hypothetical protein